jgi:hypothetical protein
MDVLLITIYYLLKKGSRYEGNNLAVLGATNIKMVLPLKLHI